MVVYEGKLNNKNLRNRKKRTPRSSDKAKVVNSSSHLKTLFRYHKKEGDHYGSISLTAKSTTSCSETLPKLSAFPLLQNFAKKTSYIISLGFDYLES